MFFWIYRIFTEHHLIFEGHEYLENVHEQVAKDQIKLTKQRYHREKKTLLKGDRDSALIRQLESDNKEQEERILAAADVLQKDIIEYEIWSLAHIKHLYPRRYLLRENALEIWIAGTSKSFFFTFKNSKRRGEVIAEGEWVRPMRAAARLLMVSERHALGSSAGSPSSVQ